MDFLTLEQLNGLIAGSLKQAFPETYWLMAEMSDLRVNPSSGHCYLEFIQKNDVTGSIIARTKAYIWKNAFQILKPYFEQTTGQSFVSGLKVLVRVEVNFHGAYGLGLTIHDIDPSYTMGDMQRRRQEIINKLDEEGVLTLNKELMLSQTLQRIAVVTSSTAAGYEDFMDHLLNNQSGFIFYPKIFPAVMQGDQTEASIITALDKIYEYRDLFDLVVIIRGGGATSDLSSFDSYLLAANCAQFPLPIITGIGHERDDTVLDIVAYKRAKTPTAVADFLIQSMQESFDDLIDSRNTIVNAAGALLEKSSVQLRQLTYALPDKSFALISRQNNALGLIKKELKHAVTLFLMNKEVRLKESDAFLKLSSPFYVLSKGYTITRKDGRLVNSICQLQKGDKITTSFLDGDIESELT